MNERAKKNLEAANTFLENNKSKEGITTTDSGLQFEILTEGQGEKPTIENVVNVHYVGTLIDGSEFDSSIKRGHPAQFPLRQVIQGFSEGIQLMSPKAKYRFFMHPDLAYGETSAGSIAPNALLIFEVELLHFS